MEDFIDIFDEKDPTFLHRYSLYKSINDKTIYKISNPNWSPSLMSLYSVTGPSDSITLQVPFCKQISTSISNIILNIYVIIQKCRYLQYLAMQIISTDHLIIVSVEYPARSEDGAQLRNLHTWDCTETFLTSWITTLKAVRWSSVFSSFENFPRTKQPAF